MIFEPTSLAGAFLVMPDRHCDERGFFARTWCTDEFAEAGLPATLAQCSISWNERQHTLRGMHWELRDRNESKLVRCTRGAVHDVIVDLRPESATYLQHLGVRLDADNRTALFVPPGFGHGFLTLVDRSEVFYQMDTIYAPGAERGARWDDPAFAIDWPAGPEIMSSRDRSFPDFAVESNRVTPV